MKAVTETGSLINHVMSQATTVIPQVGMGATMLSWTDRTAGTIVKVTATQIHVQRDKATRTDTNGMSEVQEYSYERDENAWIAIFRKTKRGYRDECGRGLAIGYRSQYHDFSF